ncbi:hypothetical protein G6O67_003525 [Ophiocordyceps sinensis]|uniref:Subtilisin-like serine protease PR1C n=1 Tax=Ophiocordyceps sinensis TaxID=72228 RepID=A0A8H4PS25_9HYPO|nr:hypothetical protein G6O67_003525 [Ophiocordyceps sinensis]
MVRRLTLALSLAAAASLVVGADETPNKAPGLCAGQDMYLIEIDQGASLDEVLKPVEANMNMTRCRTMEFSLFKGASIQVGQGVDMSAILVELEKTAGVKDVSVVTISQGPEVPEQGPEGSQVEEQGPEGPKAQEKGPVEDTLGGKGATEKRNLKNQTTSKTTHMAQRLAQVDVLHEEGYTGKGVRVALIDSGVDYTHPALGGCFGPGCLVSFGTDVAGDSGAQNLQPAGTPTDCSGHGTSVAGIVATQRANSTLGFSGVAPGVTLGMYKVHDCLIAVPSDVFVQAIYQAYDDQADIISISMGSRSGWAGHAVAEAASRVVSAGVHVVAAAGNGGKSGLFGTESPATGRGVLAVANMVSPSSPELKWTSTYSVDDGEETEFEHQVGPGSDWGRLQSYNLHSTSDDACSPLTPPPKDSIVLVRDGDDCDLSKKGLNVLRATGHFMMVADNRTALDSLSYATAKSAVSAGLGDTWMQALKDMKRVTIKMHVVGLVESPNGAAGAVATTSSWGPDWELNMKPQLGAPGGRVSTTRIGGGFEVTDGTSFSAPFVAGVMALITEARGKLEPAVMASLLSTTARPQRFHDGDKFHAELAPIAQQGGGLIQAHAALHATTLLTPSSISFNDTGSTQSHSLNIQNTGKDAVTFSLSYTPALTVYATEASSSGPAEFPDSVETVEASATLQLSQDSVTVAAGQAATIDITASHPTGLDAGRLPLWSGCITVNGTDGNSLTVPYQGLAAPLRNHTLLRDTNVQVAVVNRLGQYDSAGPSAVFALNTDPRRRRSDRKPIVVVRPTLGVPQLNIHVVRKNTTTSAYDKVAQLPGLPASWLPIHREVSHKWDGTLADGSLAPEGLYNFQVSALHILGEASNDADWDIVQTDVIEIKHHA